MLNAKRFWQYVSIGGAIALVIIAIMIWHYYQQVDISKPDALSSQSVATQTLTNYTTSNDKTFSIDENAPAPAKKLHQLLTDTDQETAETLNQHIHKANKSIKKINHQLNEQGVTTSQAIHSVKTYSNNGDIHQRLRVIQDHIKNKTSQ